MDPLSLLEKYGKGNPEFLNLIVNHSQAVAKKALEIAKKFPQVNLDFVYKGAMLHDIGCFFTYFPKFNEQATEPYIKHGVIGRDILEKEGYLDLALVCERHIGVGITKQEIIEKKLPLPLRDMVPQTLEEKIIAFADKFFSKVPERVDKEKSVEEIKKELRKYGEEKVRIFETWYKEFLNKEESL
ncbi:HD domain-containing protein [Thermodesulfobacterium commune]|uniref:Phosphohydrolase n=1 Tax=Thermodesulfobacterium commune DSM 2178 TaxID=289377 RepID=A0A075WTJ8_9BACT|nr:HD domain-containing protein [Thermodesulfobacterium commune]AIH04196.1 phosphohydrolase [Thermodesulfobacterium commune DSM 2178]